MLDLPSVCTALEQYGYCIIEDVLDATVAAKIDVQARRFMQGGYGYANLEGALTCLPALAPLCEEPIVLAIGQHFFGEPFYLANNVCMKWCPPGTERGKWHVDWPLGHMPQPYPAWPVLLQTMWMLTDFTDSNGATWVVPGSHRQGRPPKGEEATANRLVIEGKAGSLLVWLGGLWHCSGVNTTSDQHRMGANIAYIPRYIHRPPDTWPLVQRVEFAKFSPVLQQLLERSVESF